MKCFLVATLGLVFIFTAANSTDWHTFRKNHVRLAPFSGRIIGGNVTEPNEYPYQTGLIINGYAFCGGSLISKNYVLTAAHCASVIDGTDVEVILGAHNITDASEATQVIIKNISNVIVHEDYNETSFQNDIALIQLGESAPLNDVIRAVTLPSRADENNTYFAETVTSIGWGLANDVLDHIPSIKDLSSLLRKVNVTILDIPDCGDYYNDEDFNIEYITEKNVCTSGYQNKGTCNGDSGGPLLHNGTQIGLVSFGTDLCESCSPSVFTNLCKFLDWIAAHSDVEIS